MSVQQQLPNEYRELTGERLAERIAARKVELGGRLCILGHHYQRDEVIRFADFTGDSLKLSQLAAGQREAEFIVFCGVQFMAESADVLSSPRQVVCLPNLEAGCLMADMVDEASMRTALEELAEMAGAPIVPISYVNTSAAIKAVTGRAGGACCTSGNARRVFEWALSPGDKGGAGGEKILAVPDQHLALNTAAAMGYDIDRACALYDPDSPAGGLTAEDVRRATFILWKGYCHVHQVFTAEQIDRVRADRPGIRVIVHPECPRDIVAAADAAGSTEQIIRAVADSPAGSQWAVGTESNLVNRLARRHGEKYVRVLSGGPACCWQMGKIDLPHLLWVLDNLAAGNIVNRVAVPADVAADARIALQRMIDIKAADQTTPTGRE